MRLFVFDVVKNMSVEEIEGKNQSSRTENTYHNTKVIGRQDHHTVFVCINERNVDNQCLDLRSVISGDSGTELDVVPRINRAKFTFAFLPRI